MKQCKEVKLGFVLACMSLLAGTTWASEVEFRFEKAIVAGTGCSLDDTAIYSDGGRSLYLDFSSMYVYLPYYTELMSERKSCSVRLPMKIPQGHYIRSLRQSVGYGIFKTADTTASIISRVSFSNFGAQPLSILARRGEEIYQEDEYAHQEVPLNQEQIIQSLCKPERADEFTLQMNLVASGQKSGRGEEVYIGQMSGQVALAVNIELVPCESQEPLPKIH